MSDQKRVKRSQYFISARFQLKYIAQFIIVLYVGAAIAGYTVYYTAWLTLGEKLANVYPRGRFVYIFHAANMVLLLRLLLITPLFVLIGTFLSHRIAGPVYRIGMYVDTLIRGDLSRGLSLRKKDELKDLAAKMSELRDNLNQNKEKRQKTVSDLVKSLEDQKVNSKVLDEIKDKLGEL